MDRLHFAAASLAGDPGPVETDSGPHAPATLESRLTDDARRTGTAPANRIPRAGWPGAGGRGDCLPRASLLATTHWFCPRSPRPANQPRCDDQNAHAENQNHDWGPPCSCLETTPAQESPRACKS
jgi:hypothetical protein